MARIHFVSAHFGGTPPWRHTIQHPHHQISCAYYDDFNTPSRHLAMHPRLKAKIPKMLEWQFIDADWYVWLDSSIRIRSDAICDWVLDTAGDNPLCLYKHSFAHSIHEEAKRVRDNLDREIDYIKRRYAGEPILEQVIHYYGDPDFVDNQLFGLTLFAYHRSASHLMLNWFHHNVIWSIQDQLSFPYCLQKSGLAYSLFDGLITEENPFFEWDWMRREENLNQGSGSPALSTIQ